MEDKTIYSFDGYEFELYQAASKDWCVTVSIPFTGHDSYNLGSKEKALEFILSYAEVHDDEDDEDDEGDE